MVFMNLDVELGNYVFYLEVEYWPSDKVYDVIAVDASVRGKCGLKPIDNENFVDELLDMNYDEILEAIQEHYSDMN